MTPLSEPPGALTERGTGQELPAIRAVPPGPIARMLAARLERVECPAFGRRRRRRAEPGSSEGTGDEEAFPIVLASGHGSNLWDVDGNRYVDMVASFGSMLLGHGASALTYTIQGQTERLVQGLGDVYATDVKVALVERIAALHPGTRPQVLLCQSGSDAITAALKTTILYTGKPGVLAFDGAYHGLGYAPLATCGYRESLRRPFAAQLSTHVQFAPYPGVRGATAEVSLALAAELLAAEAIGTVLIEPVLGRGGCVVPPNGFVPKLCELAHRHGALVVADEIWTGLGRAGSMVRSVEIGAEADVLCFGKGLGGGLPVSACVAPERVMQAWTQADEVIHTSTHHGAALPCAAAVATLDTLRTKRLDARAREIGGQVLESLRNALGGCERVSDVRGVGLMIGIELDSAATASAVTRTLLERGWLLIGGGVCGDVLTLTPALTIDESLFVRFGTALRAALDGRPDEPSRSGAREPKSDAPAE